MGFFIRRRKRSEGTRQEAGHAQTAANICDWNHPTKGPGRSQMLRHGVRLAKQNSEPQSATTSIKKGTGLTKRH